MTEVRHEQFRVLVKHLAARWLTSAERDLPAGARANLIGERALDAYENTEDEEALIAAAAALSAADALGSTVPVLRSRLERLQYVSGQEAALPLSAEDLSDLNELDDLPSLLASWSEESRMPFRAPRPAALEAASGYTGEVSTTLLLPCMVVIRDALDASLPLADDPDLAMYARLASRGRSWLSHTSRSRIAGDLDQTVDRLSNTIESFTDAVPPWRWSLVLGDLAQALLLRHDIDGPSEDLARAVDHARTAVRISRAAEEPEQLVTWLSLLGTVLWARYDADGDPADLRDAADALWEAADPARVTAAPLTGRSTRLEWLRLVGAVERQQYAASRHSSYLDRALRLHHFIDEEPQLLGRPATPPAMHASLGYTWLSVQDSSGESRALDSAVWNLEQAVAEAQESNPAEWGEWTGILVSALRARFAQRGDQDSLESLVRTCAQVLDVLPEGTPEYVSLLGSLGEALLWRYVLVGTDGDLRTARILLEQAEDRSALAAALHADYLRGSDLRALDAAVRIAAEEVRASAGPDGAHLPTAFDLAQYLLSRAEVLSAPGDAVSASRLLDHCLKWPGQSREHLAFLKVEYGRARLILSEAHAMTSAAVETNDHGDNPLEDAAATLVDVMDSPDIDETLTAAAGDLLVRAVTAVRDEACRSGQLDSDIGPFHLDRPVWRRALALLDERAADSGRHRRLRTLDDFRQSPQTVRDELCHRVVDVVTQHPGAGNVQLARHITRDAGTLARWCLEVNEPRIAFEVAESGRAVITNAATGADPIVDRLTRRGLPLQNPHPLHSLGTAGASFGGHRPSLPRLAPAGPVFAPPQDLSGTVQVALEELDDVFTPEATAALCRDMRIDAVVHLLAGRNHGWALVVYQDGRLISIRLPLLRANHPALSSFAAEHDKQLRSPVDGPSGAWQVALRKVCDWAWQAVFQELSARLVAFLGASGTARIVLIPSGTLALVPWHAARRRVKEPGGWIHRFAIESMAISYAPSARALLWFTDRSLAPLADNGLVVVDPTRDLPHARQEGEDIHRWHYPKGQRLGSSGEQGATPATPRAVLSALSGAGAGAACPVAHFACHAMSRVPAKDSYLQLANGQRLSVARLLDQTERREGGARSRPLVVLSACATAVPGAHYDGALSLATAFAAAGAAAVVGSLWAVDDAATAALMRDFHSLLNLDGMPPAEALRIAQLRALRDARARAVGRGPKARSRAGDPSSWAAFVHQGLGHPAAGSTLPIGSAIADLPDATAAARVSQFRMPIFPSLPGPGPSTFKWTCPVPGCSEEAPGDTDSPFDADCCPAHPDDAFVLT
ncbi:CHAT domain-containing protein [Streptomyces sp. MMS24-I2-30]|uniref:CHAT domain-containing protein n=1 Tax=Streptomyces sp. MMS24-I2-30 TaxID=3351564 RepID=UPI0038969F8D